MSILAAYKGVRNMRLIKEIIGYIEPGSITDEKMAEGKRFTLILSDNQGEWHLQIPVEKFNRFREQATSMPVKIVSSQIKGTEDERFVFLYKDKYYVTEIEMQPDEVLLVLKNTWQSKKDNLKKELERVRAKAEFEGAVRMPISQDVQILVWNRDGGKCVKCGGTEKLEFDHIIPLSKGGSNSARNIQLLCEHCNRSKGANVGG